MATDPISYAVVVQYVKMLAPLLSLLIPLVAVVVGGLLSAAVTYKLTQRKEDRSLRRQKLEELHLVFEKYAWGLFDTYSNYCTEMQLRKYLSDSELDELKARSSSQSQDSSRPYDELKMLIAIYFPQLEPALTEFLKYRTVLGTLLGDYFENRDQGPEIAGQIRPINNEMLGSAKDIFLDAIRSEVRKLD